MRVIAGTLKGRRIHPPPAGDLQVRPTSDRAREALFSILQRWDQGSFLDLCAGTGAVGLEALSRGYAPVTAVEGTENAGSCLRRNAAGTALSVVMRNALSLKSDHFSDLAVIFIDPPYEDAERFWAALSPRLRSWIAPSGVLVFETSRKTTLELQPRWELAETREYGAARFHFWTPA